ncbi:DNA ligase [Paenibacillus sp. IB182496]|uniref:DNA ligase n=1 Tax=Paenibacillus sabuli TaxID=2772509 RepID=A0A927GTX4_9BACL|nr:DNA ligase [Paenibacillus sabuli]
MPAEPMAPLVARTLPEGDAWGYQLKWDGVRLLAEIKSAGEVALYSRRLLRKDSVYPEIVRALRKQAHALEDCLLDGELVYWDGDRPSFAKVLQRERAGATGRSSAEGRLLYVVFDLLVSGGRDVRNRPLRERHELLQQLLQRAGAGAPSSALLPCELYRSGADLWSWVEARSWEGVVAKRLDGPYREGKRHDDWRKVKTALRLPVDIVGLKLREGRVASLVMAEDGAFVGSVSLGLSEAMRELLRQRLVPPPQAPTLPCPFVQLPAELTGARIVWLAEPLPCRVTGLERTAAGLLRHPKLLGFGRDESG